MATIDNIRAKARCPHCGLANNWNVQIYFGDVWANEWTVGDKLSFSPEEYADYPDFPPSERIKIKGNPIEDCPNCQSSEIYAEIHLHDFVIESVLLAKEPLELGKLYDDGWANI